MTYEVMVVKKDLVRVEAENREAAEELAIDIVEHTVDVNGMFRDSAFIDEWIEIDYAAEVLEKN